jgi:hypothetical protein
LSAPSVAQRNVSPPFIAGITENLRAAMTDHGRFTNPGSLAIFAAKAPGDLFLNTGTLKSARAR